MAQHQEKATVIRVERLSTDNYRLTLHSPQIAAAARPGQFVMVQTGTGRDPLLRRPFSLHQVSEGGRLQLYFKTVGRGTDILAHLCVDETVDLFGPLGRGFQLHGERPACLIGGGLGIAPLLFLVKELCRLQRDFSRDLVILGGRSADEVEPLVEDFRQFGLPVCCTTDDGSFGRQGLVTELLVSEQVASGSAVYGCGPDPMLARVHQICLSRQFSCQVSVESVMACGMGACLGCNRSAAGGGYLHVCIDGPVFRSEELAWSS